MRVLIIDIDTLRPDHMGCYGYHRNTTPNIDRIAAEGTRFTNYYCSDAPCLPSRTALVTGQHGIHSGVVTHGGTTAEFRHEGATRSTRSLHELGGSLHSLFRYAGYHTVFVGPFIERHAIMEWGAGFMEILNSGGGGHEKADKVCPIALDWLERNAEREDWYLYVNFWDPHARYGVPEEYGRKFADEPGPDWMTDEILAHHHTLAGSHTAADYGPKQERLRRTKGEDWQKRQLMPPDLRTLDSWKTLIDGYDTCISYADMHVGKILSLLEEKGIGDDLMVIVTADHGENIGELGIYCEHDTATHSVCNIPLIVKLPGGKGGQVRDALHYNIDLVPTLNELFGLREKVEANYHARPPVWDGASFADSLTGDHDEGRDYLVVGQLNHTCQRGVRWGDHMYTYTYHDGYALQLDEEMLFNVVDDPHQIENLAGARPDLCAEASRLLHRWHTHMMKTMPHGYDTDPLWTVMREGGPCFARDKDLAPYFETLARTGRADKIAEYKRRHPEIGEQEP